MYSIETKELTHRFSATETVLDHINLQVPQGAIYGFLGPNGAGKTTTLKLLLGLLRRQEGEILFFGKPFAQHRLDILRQTGSLIESPSLYGQLTAYENLKVHQLVHRCPEKRIREVLERMGLADTGRKKVSRFSLGMKQRLSIAVALLHEPALLLLDEPTNGLDPNGIIEMRELLRELHREGMTIVVSSHLLAEVEKMVTHVGIIHKGALRFQGTLRELSALEPGASVRFRTSDPVKTAALFRSAQLAPVTEEEAVTVSVPGRPAAAALVRLLVDNGIDVFEMMPLAGDLESLFTRFITN